MIITLSGATATKHLGGLNFYSIIVNKSSGVTVTLDKTTVDKATAASATVTGKVTVADGYTLSSLVIKMGDTDKTSAWYNASTGAITISGITANVTIIAIAASESGSGDSGDSGDSGSGDSGTTETVVMEVGNAFLAETYGDATNRATTKTSIYLNAGQVVTLLDNSTYKWACTLTTEDRNTSSYSWLPESVWTTQKTYTIVTAGYYAFVLLRQDNADLPWDSNNQLNFYDYFSIT